MKWTADMQRGDARTDDTDDKGAVRAICALGLAMCARCRGPAASHALVAPNQHTGYMQGTCQASTRVLDACRLDHPVAKLLVSASRGHADGGWLALLMTSFVAREALKEGCGAPWNAAHFAKGVHEAVGWCIDVLDGRESPGDDIDDARESLPAWMNERAPTTPTAPAELPPAPDVRLRVSFRSAQGMLALTRAVVWPRHAACGLTPDDVEQACVALCKAVVLAADARGGTGIVRVARAPGNHASGTRAVPGAVLDGAAAPASTYALRGRLLPAENARCVLLTSSLDFARDEAKDADHGDAMLSDIEAVASDSADIRTRVAKRRAMLADLTACFRLGQTKGESRTVDVVFCQKVVHPTVQAHLARHGVLVVERLGTQGAALVARLTGARAIADLTRLRLKGVASVAGTIGTLSAVALASGNASLHLTPPGDGGGVATVLACAPTEAACDELAHALGQARDVLQRCTDTPTAVPGGGCTEALLANYVQARCKALLAKSNSHQDAFTRAASASRARGRGAVVSALEMAVALLAPPGFDAGEENGTVADAVVHANTKVTQANAATERAFYGLDAAQGGRIAEVAVGCGGELLRGSCVDFAPAKLSALSAAREVVAQVLRCHNVVSEV